MVHLHTVFWGTLDSQRAISALHGNDGETVTFREQSSHNLKMKRVTAQENAELLAECVHCCHFHPTGKTRLHQELRNREVLLCRSGITVNSNSLTA
jgi:hypothetical protein